VGSWICLSAKTKALRNKIVLDSQQAVLKLNSFVNQTEVPSQSKRSPISALIGFFKGQNNNLTKNKIYTTNPHNTAQLIVFNIPQSKFQFKVDKMV
jgi:hypothetical protein